MNGMETLQFTVSLIERDSWQCETKRNAQISVLSRCVFHFSGIMRKFTRIWLVVAFEILSSFVLADEACDCSVLCTNPVISYECTWD